MEYEWTDWLNKDAPDNALTTGDWETINSFGERKVCSMPSAVLAYPIDRTGTQSTRRAQQGETLQDQWEVSDAKQ